LMSCCQLAVPKTRVVVIRLVLADSYAATAVAAGQQQQQ
jgi:hypothetical protein